MLKAHAITKFKDGWWLNVALSDSDHLIGLLFKVRNSLDSVQGERHQFRKWSNISSLKTEAKIRTTYSTLQVSVGSPPLLTPGIQRSKVVWKFESMTYALKSLFSWILFTWMSSADDFYYWTHTIKLVFWETRQTKYHIKYYKVTSVGQKTFFAPGSISKDI